MCSLFVFAKFIRRCRMTPFFMPTDFPSDQEPDFVWQSYPQRILFIFIVYKKIFLFVRNFVLPLYQKTNRYYMLNTKSMTTKIMLSSNMKTYDVWYSNNNHTFVLHKKGFKNLDDAIKETNSIKGSLRLLRDLQKS